MDPLLFSTFTFEFVVNLMKVVLRPFFFCVFFGNFCLEMVTHVGQAGFQLSDFHNTGWPVVSLLSHSI